MTTLALVTLAQAADAREIAEMSRDLIEGGLIWAWTPGRVLQSIASKDSSVIVTRRERRIAAFAMMHFGDDTAHLNLLAVAAPYRRQGLGRQLLVDALSRAVSAVEIVSGRYIVVDAIDEDAVAFYRRYGFTRLPAPSASRLIMKSSDASASLVARPPAGEV